MPINHEMALQKVSSQKLTAPEDESSWHTVIESKLPDTSSELSKLLGVVGKLKVNNRSSK